MCTSLHIYNTPHVQRALALAELVYVLLFILGLLIFLREICKLIKTKFSRWQFPVYLCGQVYFWSDRLHSLTTIVSDSW